MAPIFIMCVNLGTYLIPPKARHNVIRLLIYCSTACSTSLFFYVCCDDARHPLHSSATTPTHRARWPLASVSPEKPHPLVYPLHNHIPWCINGAGTSHAVSMAQPNPVVYPRRNLIPWCNPGATKSRGVFSGTATPHDVSPGILYFDSKLLY